MNASHWLNERSLLAISGATLRSSGSQQLLIRRNFAILRPNNRAVSPRSLNWNHGIIRAKRTAPTAPCRLTKRTFWAHGSKSTSTPTPHLGSPEASPSLSQKLKDLSRKYGWSAVGVYFTLSVLDFPFCFLGVRLLGTDRIARWEHVVIGKFWDLVRVAFPDFVQERQERQAAATAKVETMTDEEREGIIDWTSDVAQAEAINSGSNASIWTQLVLAYAIHKSFIFIRVPLTAAVTPKIVKWLQRRGWNIGNKKAKVKAPKT